jgi:hypothetical protein
MRFLEVLFDSKIWTAWIDHTINITVRISVVSSIISLKRFYRTDNKLLDFINDIKNPVLAGLRTDKMERLRGEKFTMRGPIIGDR